MLQFKADLIRPINQAAKFVEIFIFLRGRWKRNDVQNLKLSLVYKNIRCGVFIITLVKKSIEQQSNKVVTCFSVLLGNTT